MKNIILSSAILLTFSIVAHAIPVFTISGKVAGEIHENYEITVENQTRGLSQTGIIYKDLIPLKYSVIFMAMEDDGIVAAAGDKLQFLVKDEDEIFESNSYMITEEDIENANANIPIMDETPPYIEGWHPTKDVIDVSVDTKVSVDLRDNWTGVDKNSIVMKVDGEQVSPTILAVNGGYVLTHILTSSSTADKTITVTIDAQDLAAPPNVMPQDVRTFTTAVTLIVPKLSVECEGSSPDNVACNHVGDVILVTGKGYPSDTNVGRLLIDEIPKIIFPEGCGEVTPEYEIITASEPSECSFRARVQIPKRAMGPMKITVGNFSTYFEVKPNIIIELYPDFTQVSGYGFAPDEKVNISFGGEEVQTFADENGYWEKERVGEIIDVKACGGLSRQCAKRTFKMIYNLARGWNLISFPGDVIEPSPDGFSGNDIIQILNADYETPEAFEVGKAYWVLAIENTKRKVEVIPQEIYTRKIKRGWNMIGSVYGEACIPEGVIQLSRWNATVKEMENISRIEWGIGYWALAIKDIEITVDGTKPCAPAPPLYRSKTQPLWDFPIQVMAKNGGIKTAPLTIGIHPNAKSGLDSRFDIALPPLSPDRELPHAALLLDGDVPLRLSKKIMPMPETGITQFLLQMDNPAGDTMLSWDTTQVPAKWSLALIDQTKRIDMKQQSVYPPTKGKSEIVIELSKKAVRSSKEQLPKETALLQNFPNPFNPETWIPYQLSSPAEVSIAIYDAQGRIAKQLSVGKKEAGIYNDKYRAAMWDGRNEHGERVSSGIYFYRLKAGNFSAVRRMVIAK